jgi:hypothetical protein
MSTHHIGFGPIPTSRRSILNNSSDTQQIQIFHLKNLHQYFKLCVLNTWSDIYQDFPKLLLNRQIIFKKNIADVFFIYLNNYFCVFQVFSLDLICI